MPVNLTDINFLDYHLREAMIFLRESDNMHKGVVAACFTDGGKSVYATSEKYDDGRSIHAERNVIRTFLAKYGKLPDKAALVTSLLPCTCNSQFREGGSCTEILLGNDPEFPNIVISHTHAGIIDETQNSRDGFKFTLTTNKILKRKSYQLANLLSRI